MVVLLRAGRPELRVLCLSGATACYPGRLGRKASGLRGLLHALRRGASATRWYPFIVPLPTPRRDNEQRGPVRAEELSRLYDAAAVHDLTYVWHDGLSSWTVLHQSTLEYVAPQYAPPPGPPVAPPKMLALPPPPPPMPPPPPSPPPPGAGESVSERASSSVDVGRHVSAQL